MQYSATAVVLLPGRLATAMPRAVAAFTGMKSMPTPWRTMPLSFGAWSTMSSGSLARTMMPSTSAAAARSVSGCVSDAVTERACGARMAAPSGWIGLVRRTSGLSAMAQLFGSGDAIALDDGAVDLDSQSGVNGNSNLASLLHDRLARQVITERIFLLLELEHGRDRKQARRLVGDRGQEVDRCGQADGRSPGVGNALDAVRGGQCRDLLALGDAARRANVRLHDVHGLARDRLAKTPAGELVLAAGDRHVERLRDLHVAVDVFRRYRLLEPFDVELLQAAAKPDGGRHAEAVIGIDHELDVVADCLAHREHALVVAPDGAEADLHLDRLEAVLHVALGFLDGLRHQAVHVGEIEAGRVGMDLGAEGATDQLVDRLAARLADDVPQRDVDAADGRNRHAFRAVVLDPVVEVFPDHFRVERIAAEHARRELRIDEGLRDRGGTVALAPAGDAVGGFDLDQAGAARTVEPPARRGERPLHRGRHHVTGDAFDRAHENPAITGTV